jgi:hypothetical protein
LATLPPSAADVFRADLCLVQDAIRTGVVPGRAAAADNHWDRWVAYCHSLGHDPWLFEVPDRLPILQVFGARYRDGRLAPMHKPVRSRTVEHALRAVGQTFAHMGTTDIRKDCHGRIDFRLQRQLRAYAKADPPPNRVKPIPIQVLHHVLAAAYSTAGTTGTQAIADMIVIAFFYLLRPGEYTGTPSDNTPFRLADVQLFIGNRRLDLTSDPVSDLAAATSASLTFTTQKSGVRGEVVNHGRSGASLACPVLAIIRRVTHLRSHGAPPNTPLASYFNSPHQLRPVTAANITDSLRTTVATLGPSLGLLPPDISARSLRAGGAMALLCSSVDSHIIRLLGRWQSDVMMRYLHLQAQPVMRGFARLMLQGGDYTLHPGEAVPMH